MNPRDRLEPRSVASLGKPLGRRANQSMEPKAKSFRPKPPIIGDTESYDLPTSSEDFCRVCSYLVCGGLGRDSCARTRINAAGATTDAGPAANESAGAATIESSGAARTDGPGAEGKNSGGEDGHIERPAVLRAA